VIPNLLHLALDFYRNPRRFEHLRDPNTPLPANLTELLSAPAKCLAPGQLATTAAALNATEAECVACVPFFIKQVLLEPKGDFFRVLGVSHTAPPALIKEHYRYLIRIFHPDKDIDGEGWNDLYAPRINEAYNTLRNAIQRAQYEASLPKVDSFSPAELMKESMPGQATGPASGAAVPTAGNSTPKSSVSRASILREPWFYGLIFGGVILLLLGLLLSSGNSPQLTITAKPQTELRQELLNDKKAPVKSEVRGEHKVAAVRNEPASTFSSLDEGISSPV